MRLAVFHLFMLAAAAQDAGAQGAHEVVRGRVTSHAAPAAVMGASVTVTKTTDGTAQTTRSDGAGAFRVDWPSGSSSYLVQITAAGFQPFRKIVTRAAADSVIDVDAVLEPSEPAAPSAAATRLAAVVTKATRPTPDRQQTTDPGPGAVDAVLNPTFASRRLSPDLAGDLNALAAMTPGVLSTAGGISVLGLGPTQNLVTLNGLAFPSGDIPRATPTLLHLTTTSYDPSIGWFSGARSNVDLAPGGPFSARTVYWTADAPLLQFTDPVGNRSGARFADVDASVGGGGQLAKDRLAYTFGVEGGRKTSSPATLATAGGDVLAHAGIAADSATRTLDALARLGVPTGAPTTHATAEKVTALVRIDRAPYDWNALEPAKTTFGLVGFGKLTRQAGLALSPTATPAHGGESSQAMGVLQAGYSTYFGDGYLANVHMGVTSVHSASRPYVSVPDGQVLVASNLGTGSALSAVQFGGNGLLDVTSSQWTWETQGDLQFFPAGRSIHRIKVTVDSRLDAASRTAAANPLGTFTYNSLQDLLANQPASFARTVGTATQRSGAWNGFMAIGDLWRAKQNLQVAYGVRADADATTRVPALNPAIDSVFGVRTNRGPGSWALSPRAGFTYSTATPRWLVPSAPLGVLHGGAGAFRNLADPTLMAAASAATGLADSPRQVSCAGPAVPAALWGQFAADAATIPAQCASGAPSLTDVARNVAVVDPNFRPATSWRANLGWSSSVGPNLYVIDATYSLNRSQPGVDELNFAGTPRFTLADENRPVFAAPTGISSGGVTSAADARRDPSFGSVVRSVSDLRSASRQLTVTTRPYFGSWIKRYTGDITFSYTLSDVRAEQRGFDASTFGDPSTLYWSRAALDARHQITAGMNVRPFDGLNLFLFGHAQSGLPFTPIVGSDVNGDGLVNDRAFVFDPARAGAAMASDMTRLLAGGSDAARCLATQLGQAARPMSCEGPWSATLNIAALLDGTLLRTQRGTVTVNFANVLGGLDLLAHGANGLRGWGTTPVPDPVLYRVTSFDAASRRFGYAVNPRFGSTAAAATALRTPFRITIDVNIDVAPPMARQQLDRWLAPGRAGRSGKRLSADELARRYARSVPDPYTKLLEQSDSLVLSNDQIASLQRADDRLRARLDSIWRTLGDALAHVGDEYDAGVVARRADDAVDAAWEIARVDVRQQLDAILSPVQRSEIAGWAKVLYTADRPVHFRLFITGS